MKEVFRLFLPVGSIGRVYVARVAAYCFLDEQLKGRPPHRMSSSHVLCAQLMVDRLMWRPGAGGTWALQYVSLRPRRKYNLSRIHRQTGIFAFYLKAAFGGDSPSFVCIGKCICND